ncbi:TIGR03564 family F420-dependent LLM class oxidoreductase [uncultured Amnibacterium sp.]|uniref:TIGR03564 family F420-dependent LLM class oxidoreductase n=1 Tax=uncultured Amnibacterium sp. TaxID=1631851 RepID=UPI0035CA2168
MTAVGVSVGVADAVNYVDAVVAHAREAADAGLASVWVGQRFDYDAITLASIIGREVEGIEVGTAAVPVFGRHPLALAMGAQTAQAATHGRFRLGLALGAPDLVERAFGIPYDRPIGMLREALTVINSVQETGTVDFHGERVSAAPPWPTPLPGAQPAPIYIAGMGPQAMKVAGSLASGIIPFLAGPRTLKLEIIPQLARAAQDAGRPKPRVIVFAMGVVTSQAESARAIALKELALYEAIPSYQRVMDLEGVERAGDLAVIGDEQQVADQFHRYVDAGATDVVFTRSHLLGNADRLRTYRMLAELASE